MYKNAVSLLVLVVAVCNISAQSLNFSISSIPDSLKEYADAVIRISEEELVINDLSSAKLRVKQVITILNKDGEKHAYLTVPYNKFFKINYVKGTFYDKNGKLIEKVKKSDIYDISHYDGFSLYTDNRLKVIGKPVEDVPYTVEYEYELTFKGILSFPSWKPVPAYNVSVQNAEFSLSVPNDYRIQLKSVNYSGNESEEKTKDRTIHKWQVEGLKAFENEPFNYDISNFTPLVLIAPSNFSLDNNVGNAESWENFGKWIFMLNAGRNKIPEETISEIKELIKDADSDYQKAKYIYEFMQKKTRYVNIALGIGGWQPFKAEETDETGYGDCKALSYYMKSLLESVGIESNYVIVMAGKNKPLMRKDFPSIQFNHAILCIPFKEDTVWLECTSQSTPFGFIGSFTDDRDVLIIDSDGKGKIAHTTVYPENLNTQIRTADIILDESGCITSEIKTVYGGIQYENVWRFLDLSDEDKEKEIKEKIAIPNMNINTFSFTNNKDKVPSVIEELDLDVKNYATLSSNRMFLVPNILNKNEYIPKKLDKRITDIIFRRGYTDTDSIIYTLPKAYKIEYLPDNIEEVNKFGSYQVSYIFENSKLSYIRKFIIHKGNFTPEDYDDLRNFYKLIYKTDKKTVVFVKQ